MQHQYGCIIAQSILSPAAPAACMDAAFTLDAGKQWRMQVGCGHVCSGRWCIAAQSVWPGSKQSYTVLQHNTAPLLGRSVLAASDHDDTADVCLHVMVLVLCGMCWHGCVHAGKRLVLAGAGLEHEQLVELAQPMLQGVSVGIGAGGGKLHFLHASAHTRAPPAAAYKWMN